MAAEFDTSDLLKRIREGTDEMKRTALHAVDVFGEVNVLGRSRLRCPRKTGFLSDSGTAEPAKDTGASISKVIGFNADYAAAVHENLTAHHEPPTEAKYLENQLHEETPRFAPYVASQLKEAGF